MTRAEVTVSTYGTTASGLPLSLPDLDRDFRRVDAAERFHRAEEEKSRAEEELVAIRERVGQVDESALQDLLRRESGWVEERRELARMVAEAVADGIKPEDSADYWQTWAELTRWRSLLLRAASGLEAAPGCGGTYISAEGGTMDLKVPEVEPEPGNHLEFQIVVAPAPGSPARRIRGVARFRQSGFAVFTDREVNPRVDGHVSTWTFRFRGREVRVGESGGAAAQSPAALFGGTYFRVPD